MGTTSNFALERRLRDASRQDAGSAYDLGIMYSSGSDGVAVDLIEAHKWFNLAGVWGEARAHACRIEVSDEMTAREIAEAQRQARAWLAAASRRAA